MSLMLGNRCFLDRDYARAVPLLEAALADDPGCDGARKKLVISYVQLGELDSSLDRLEEVLARNPRLIIDTDPDEEDCPCPGLCLAMEKRLAETADPFPILLGLGILELYCDLLKARAHLRRAHALSPQDVRLARILDLLKEEKPAWRTK